ncbi:MAG: FAD-binding oxidoreductase [Desulfosudaceae bacterium]
MNDTKEFTPDWIDTPPPEGSFRSILKWGGPDRFKHPSRGFYRIIKESLELSDADFKQPVKTGQEKVTAEVPPALDADDLDALTGIVGPENISTDTFSRLKYSSGKAMEDLLKLRDNTVENLPDLVIHPRHKDDVRAIVALCHERKIPVYIYGGGSSVTLGLECVRGGVSLAMGTHMNRILDFNETDQTITVEPGLMGPDYEDALNNAPDRFGAAHRYTGGHFPQSFEYSSVGGWVVTLGAGQASSYYGDAYDLVVSQEYVTPAGSFRTLPFPGTATGPKVNDIMKGSEGCLGVLVGVTMKIFKYFPENRRPLAYMMPDWEAAVKAVRDICQGEFGLPSILRISDPEETDVAMNMFGISGSMLDRLMVFRKQVPGRRCLLIGQADGQKDFADQVKKNVKRICRSHGGMYLTSYPMNKWRHGRFSDPYMREDLNDYGIIIDTLESSVTWDNLHHLYQGVRSYIKSHPRTICMTHASHFYAQGTNLYFIFIRRSLPKEEFLEFQRGIIDRIEQHGGSLSHHHGVGKMMGPWMERHLGPEQMAVLRAIKNHFDPHHIMNPGGTLGLNG